MRILLIVPEYPPHHIGWWGVVFKGLAKSYKDLWHQVCIITGNHTNNNIFSRIKVEKATDINLIQVPEIYSPISLLYTVMPIPFWYKQTLKKYITDFSPEFVHIHGYWLFMPAQLWRIFKELELDYTFTIHWAPVSPEKMRNPIISWAYSFYHKFYGFPLLESASKITAVSRYAKNFEIFKNYRNKIEVIWNGFNPEEYQKIDNDIFTEMWIRKNKDTKIILSLGRIEWIKWFDKIIQLLPDIESKWHDVEYVIAGRDNWEKDNLIELAKKLWVEKKVHYLWFIEKNEKMSALTHCDIVAIPSETESYWLVGLEARFFWKPVITTFAWWLQDALNWYNWAYKIEEIENVLKERNIQDKNISDFYWEEIAKQYLLTQ